MRRIAFVSEHASPVGLLGGDDAGGQNVYVDEVARGLAGLGWAVDVFTRRDHDDAPEIVNWAPGMRVVNLSAGPARRIRKDDLWPLMPAFRDALLRFAARDGARYDLVHANFWMSGWVALQLRRDLGVPTVQIFHALGATKRRHQGSADTSPPNRVAVERDIVHGIDRLIASCPGERTELIDDYDAAPSKIEAIPLGVDTERFRPEMPEEARRRVGFGLTSEDRVIVYVGRLVPRKDVRNIVRAIAVLARREDGTQSPVKLLVVGGESREPDPAMTPEIGEIRRLAAELGVAELVHCTGKRQPDELRFCYGAADVVVTTPWYEPFGLTPLEAMACGRPVVGAAVGGIAFTVMHGQTGLLIPPRDPEALADAMALLLDRPELRGRLGRGARARVEQNFTWLTVAHRTGALYESLLTKRTAGCTQSQRTGAYDQTLATGDW